MTPGYAQAKLAAGILMAEALELADRVGPANTVAALIATAAVIAEEGGMSEKRFREFMLAAAEPEPSP